MARPVRAMLPSTILVVALLFQVADSSRPLSTAPAAVPRAIAEPQLPHHHRDAAETGNGRVAVDTTAEDDGSRTTTRAEEGGAAAAALSATTTTTTTLSARGKQQDDDGIGSRNGSRPAAAVQVLLRSRVARRFLAGAEEGAADSAAKPSCRSSDVHNGCPPSEH